MSDEVTAPVRTPAAGAYRRGRALEYRVRDRLRAHGFFTMRSPGSKSPVDVLAIRTGVVVMVQCKRGGALPPAEWNALLDLAGRHGAIPVMAEMGSPRGTKYWRLTGPKDGRGGPQPMVQIELSDLY